MFSPGGLGQTIAVVDKSGKVVSTSRHLLNVFNEAKAAYREKKAEITAAKGGQGSPRGYKPGRAYTIDEGRSTTSSHRSHRSNRSRKPPQVNGQHATQSRSRRYSEGSPADHVTTRSLEMPSQDFIPPPLPSRPTNLNSPVFAPLQEPLPPSLGRPKPLIRAQTTFEGHMAPISVPPLPKRSYSTDNIDMDLAYGEPPPNLMTSYKPDDVELRGLVGRAKGLLDEAHCVQHSVKTTMASLQKNPEAMAAVALTLGEISNLARKMAPGALMKVRMLAPSVFALLTSPSFLIAAGVGVGVTVIALGGYKVIKKIQAGKEQEQPTDQMIALSSEVSRIETWRQGVADIEANSVGTSTEGELITPAAAQLSRLTLAEAPTTSSRPRAPRKFSSTPSSSSNRSSSSRSSRSSKTETTKGKRKKRIKKEEKAKPSPLRNMFSF